MTDATADSTHRSTDVPGVLLTQLDDRWSPRSFDPEHHLEDARLDALLQAARWAPSASNVQPRRFIVGRRGTETFERILHSLMGFNSVWAGDASALLVALAEVSGPDGEPRSWAEYDLGQSIAHLSVQARAEGLHTHQMAGVDWDRIRSGFEVPSSLRPVTVTAIGVAAAASRLTEKLAAREVAPRTRLPLDELVLRRE